MVEAQMTTYTESDLATETMRAAGLTSIEEQLNAVEFADTVQSNSSVIATMNAIGLPIWNGSEIEIPDQYFIELAIRCSLPIQLKNGLIDTGTYLSMIDAA